MRDDDVPPMLVGEDFRSSTQQQGAACVDHGLHMSEEDQSGSRALRQPANGRLMDAVSNQPTIRTFFATQTHWNNT